MTDRDTLPTQVVRELEAVDAALEDRPVAPEHARLARLAVELRAQRPDIDPGFAHDLDARVAAGFRGPGRRARTRPAWIRRLGMPALASGAAASVLLALLVATALIVSGPLPGGDEKIREDGAGPAGGGGAGGGSGMGSEGVADPAARSAPGAGGAATNQDSAAPAGGGAEPATAPSVVLPPPGGNSPRSDRRTRRNVERSASLALAATPERLGDVADGVVRITDEVGGFVVTSSVSSTDADTGEALFELRLPSARLQSALARLSRLPHTHVRSRQEAAQDITAEAVSARDRLDDARAERRALLRRLARAGTDAEIESIRRRLRDVAARIAAAKADAARVRNRATFSNVSVHVIADAEAAEEADDGVWTPGDAFEDAVRVLEVLAGIALVALAILLPTGLLVLALALAARWAVRRRRERALDAI